MTCFVWTILFIHKIVRWAILLKGNRYSKRSCNMYWEKCTRGQIFTVSDLSGESHVQRVDRGRWTAISVNKDLIWSHRKPWEPITEGNLKPPAANGLITLGNRCCNSEGRDLNVACRLPLWKIKWFIQGHRVITFGGMFKFRSIWFWIHVLYLNTLQVTIWWYCDL